MGLTLSLVNARYETYNALHLQTAPVIILAFARMPPYAAFKLARTLGRMGILADIFIATPVDALEYESLVNDRPALIEQYHPAEHRNLTGLEFGSLWAILVNEAWDYDEHKLVEVRFGEGGETWLLRFPEKLVNLLAAVRDDELQPIAERWSQTEELVMRGGDDTEEILRDLRRLATESKSSGDKMYLWGSL